LVDVLKKTEAFFRKKSIETARLDAELILSHVLGLERIDLYMQFDRPLNTEELTTLRDLVARRGNREPIAWVLGRKGFWTLDLNVYPGVLVPRPDTETLIEATLALIPEDEELFIADVGCGSGCIGLSLAVERPLIKVFSTDLSDDALRCTRDNVTAHDLTKRFAVLRGPLLSPIPEQRSIDIVVSNPPYIPNAQIDELEPEVRQHEPRLALDGGDDGLDVYRALIPAAARRARRAVVVEIGAGQSDDVCSIFTDSGLINIKTHKDLAGHVRVVEGHCPTDQT